MNTRAVWASPNDFSSNRTIAALKKERRPTVFWTSRQQAFKMTMNCRMKSGSSGACTRGIFASITSFAQATVGGAPFLNLWYGHRALGLDE